MPLSAYAILNLDEAKRAVQTGANFQEEEDLITYINGVSELIEGLCGENFLARPYTETFDGDGTNKHRVRHTPILSGTGLEYAIIAGEGHTATPTADILVNAEQGLFYLEADVFEEGFQNCSIHYHAGLTAVPQAVKAAAGIMLAKFWKMRDKSLEQASSITVEGQTVTFKPEAIPGEAIALLSRYRRPRFA